MEKVLKLLNELSNFRSGEIINTIDLEIKIAEAMEEAKEIKLKGDNDATEHKTCAWENLEDAEKYGWFS